MQPIGTAAKLSGVNIETIRYYEREGVVPCVDGSVLSRDLNDFARLVGAAMCSAC